MNLPPQDLEKEYRTVCRALRESRTEEAIEAVKLIPGRLEFKKLELLSKLEAAAVKREAIKPQLQLTVFRNDGFNCEYCGHKTVLVPLLRAIAECFEVIGQKLSFSYDPHWKYSETHYAFWRDSASCDHIVPVTSGGPTNAGNLVTACSMCNLRKGNSAGFERFDGPRRPWAGLTELYPALVRKRWGTRLPGHHKAWMKLIENPASGSALAS
jgi:hypothetical protein